MFFLSTLVDVSAFDLKSCFLLYKAFFMFVKFKFISLRLIGFFLLFSFLIFGSGFVGYSFATPFDSVKYLTLTENETGIVENWLQKKVEKNQGAKAETEEQKKNINKMIKDEIRTRQKMVELISGQMPRSEEFKALSKWSVQEVLVNSWLEEREKDMRSLINEKDLESDYEVIYPIEKHVDLILGVYGEERLAKNVIKAVQGGAAFSELIKKEENKSSLKEKTLTIPLMSLPKEIQTFITVENIGSLIPKAIKTDDGFVVVQVLDITFKRAIEFKDVREKLLNDRVQMQMKAYIEGVLKKIQ